MASSVVQEVWRSVVLVRIEFVCGMKVSNKRGSLTYNE